MIHDLSDSSAAPVSFGPFRVLHQIGVGVLGPVYRAQDSVREQLVAVKVFKVDAPPEQAEEIADALQIVAHTLPRHRGLLEYIATGVERSTPYLVMTHSDVPSLDTRLKPGVALDAEEALDLIATLADAIDAAHAKGIIHGTLHPRDVFVDDRGGCRVSGFGVATTLAAAGIRVVPVRRPYSPPERVVGGPIERSADLFALGALAFELFSGRRVVGVGLDAAVRCAVSAPDVDVEHLRTALAAMLAENPVHRPSSATAFAQAVTQAVRPRGLTAAVRKRVTPNEIKMAAAAGAVAAGAAGAASAAGASAGSAPTFARSLVPPQAGGSDAARESADAANQASPDLEAAAEADTGAEGTDTPSPDALALFTRQGTLWESNRQPDGESVRLEGESVRLETVTVSPDEDPLAQFTSESDVPAAAAEAQAATEGATGSAAAGEAAAAAAAMPAALPDTIQIHDESSDEEVASIADAARHLVRTRDRESHAAGAAAQAQAPAPDWTLPASREHFEEAHAHADAEADAAGDVTADADAEAEVEAVDDRFDHIHAHAAHAAPAEHAEPGASAGALAAASAGAATAATPAAFEPVIADDERERVSSRLHDWSPADEPAEASSHPLRMLFIVLAVGLAVGVAGGYLLGQRSALRQALALFGNGSSGPATEQAAAPAEAPAAASGGSGRGTGTAPASAGSPTVVSEPTIVPEGSAPARAARPPASRSTPPSTPSASSKSSAAAVAATTARLLVRSAPARAEVTVNGVKRGETPLTLGNLPFGTHTIRVSRGGYLPVTRKVTMSASRASDTIDLDLEPERPTRAANASPPRERERTSAAATPAAAAAATAAASGPVGIPIDPADGDRASAEATAAGLGALYVLSHPAGARVLVDGQFVGNTPLLVTNVSPGNKTVRLELQGHKPWSFNVRVNAGQRVRVAASLEEGTEN